MIDLVLGEKSYYQETQPSDLLQDGGGGVDEDPSESTGV